ncbi:hypothetical protein OA670_01645 [Candidatus Pelagibacter sp.]|nr:hypothetical protein [Candidatus Pelagibacter sp.]
MTISTTTIKNSYSGNGSTTTFNYTFKITDQDDIDVIIRSSSGTETTKTITTHYTVTGVGNSGGGTVVFTAGNIPASGETVVLRRSTPLTQGVDLIENDPLPANTLEDAFDKLTSISQELQEQLDRSLKVSRTATLNTAEITDDATARAGKLLGFSADGNSLDATIDGSGVATSATAAANSATAAANSATAAASSATAAENAKNAAEAALDTFDDDFLGAKSSNPSLDNDGNALADGALYFDTTNNVMKVYDLGNTQWKQLTPTSSQQTNIDAAVANATNINAVGGAIPNINAVAGDLTDINTLAGISGLSTLGNNASSVVNAGNNITGINSFAERYRVQAGVPSSSNDVGDLVFDTTAGKLKVFDGSSYALAGSSVNGTSDRFKFVATAGQTTFSGNDANGNSLTYDVASGTAFADIYLNGVKLDPSDFTATNGTSIVLGSAAQLNDILSVVAFGTFTLSNFSASQIGSGTLGTARGGTGLSSLGTAGQVMKVNNAGNALEFGNASSAEVYGFNLSYSPSTVYYNVAVQSVGGSNKYFILGEQQKTLELLEGNTYIFDHPSAHPLRFSTDSGNSSAYTTGVTVVSSTRVQIVVASGAPTLYYYCSSHAGMGGQANTPVPFDNNLQVTTTNQGADNITNNQYAAFDDVLFSASGFTFSLSNGSLIATI